MATGEYSVLVACKVHLLCCLGTVGKQSNKGVDPSVTRLGFRDKE